MQHCSACKMEGMETEQVDKKDKGNYDRNLTGSKCQFCGKRPVTEAQSAAAVAGHVEGRTSSESLCEKDITGFAGCPIDPSHPCSFLENVNVVEVTDMGDLAGHRIKMSGAEFSTAFDRGWKTVSWSPTHAKPPFKRSIQR